MYVEDFDREYEHLLPTQTDVDRFQETGWWKSKPLFGADELRHIEEAIKRHQQGQRDRPLPAPIKPYLDWREGNGGALKISDYVAYQSSVVMRTALKPIIGAIAARLIGCDLVRLFNSSYVEKEGSPEGDAGRVGWHTDKAYWKTCSSERMITAWIPLHDVDSSSGTLLVLEASHLWEGDDALTTLQREKNFICSDHAGLEQRLAAIGRPTNVRAIELRQGEVSFHHCLTFHGSAPNRSNRPRKALILHLQDGENSYRAAYERGDRVIYNNDLMVRRLANGDPDYSDPEFCPILWHEISL